ncbi:metal-sulfur cluster assembly factor [Streptomyces roseoverticillatus]|uniref:metal-sulfur cluster assembly factor n=1 Tax=Streptomyces roseoverticillatus TaxID=66429 RepID=UPI0033EA213E
MTNALRKVTDPELGIDIVNLGLVYGMDIDDSDLVTLDMTLTSVTCPLADQIEDIIRSAVDDVVPDLVINWVWSPPWGAEKITSEGREQLLALGFKV